MRKLYTETLLTALLLQCSIVASAHDFEVDGIYYNITSSTPKTVEVTYKGEDEFSAEYSGSVTIPAMVTPDGTTYSVTSIGSRAFTNCDLTSITIPENVTSIGYEAFCGCSSLTSITIPNSVTSIGGCAFYNCYGFTSITIPESVTSIGNQAFYNCYGLTSIEVESGNTKYDSRGGCNAIIETATNTLIAGCKSTIIPNSVTSIGYSAFYGCSGLISITIPESVTSIGNQAFYNCYGLTSIEVESGNTKYDSRGGCNAIIETATNTLIAGCKSTIIPNSVTSIGYSAFYGCSGLTSITIPNSVTSIGNYAFCECDGLTSVTIPTSVTSIGNYAFINCNIRVVYNNSTLDITKGATTHGYVAYRATAVITPGDDTYQFVGDYIFTTVDGVNTLIAYTGSDKKITLPDNYKGENYAIGAGLFKNNRALTSVTIGNGVTVIGNEAFYGCTGLTSVTIGNGVTVIGNEAFCGCTGLTSVTIGNGVTVIGNEAFYGCIGLTSIEIPNNVTSIGSSAFFNCIWLKKVINYSNFKFTKGSSDYGYVAYYADNVINAPGGSIEGDFMFAVVDGVNTLIQYWGNGGVITFPESYKGKNYVIDAYAFKNNTTITSITIPNSVTSIGYQAFYGCSGLTSVTIGTRVTSISSYAFYGCSGLKEVMNFSNLKFTKGSSGYGYVAYYADNVINAPGGSIEGDFMFAVVDGVNTLIQYWGNGGAITLPESCKGGNYAIGADVFKNNTTITSVTIPNSVTSIGSYAFYNCSGLTSVTIGNGVTGIGSYAFYGCSGLKTIYNFSNLQITAGSSNYGYVAYYADNVINAPGGSVEGDFVFAKVDGVNTLIQYWGNGGAIILPESCKGGNYAIGADVFKNNTTITSVTIPNSVTSIGSNAFYGCSGLKEVINYSNLTFSKGYSSNGYVAYYADRVANIPNGSIEGDFAFGVIDSVNTLTGYLGSGGAVTLPDDYKGESYVIGARAFYNCAGLTSITIPNSVTSIGEYAFYNCDDLTSITIPSSVTSTGEWAFSSCNGLTSVIISDGITSIGKGAFYNCTGLTSVIIPNSVTSIGSSAFNNCRSLLSVTIGNGVTSIGDNAFYECYNLETVYNNSSLEFTLGSTDNGYVAYYANVVMEKNDDIQGDFVFRTKDGAHTLTRYLGSDSIITLPANYKGEEYALGYRVFAECTTLTDVTIPNNIKYISKCAFSGCSSLKNITIPSSVTQIDSAAFNGCVALEEIRIPSSVTTLGDYVFRGCSALTSIEIPYSVEALPKGVFYECSSLESVKLSDWKITTIPNSAFYKCLKLKSIKIPSSVTFIDSYAFQNCPSLTSISIPASVTSIGNWVFSGCNYLQEVIFEDGSTQLHLGDNRYSDGVGGGLFEGLPVKSVYIGRNLSYYAYSTRWCCAPFARYYANNYAPLEKAIIGPQVTNVPDYLFQDCKYLNTIISYIPASSLPAFNSYGEYFTPSDVKLYIPVGEKETYENTGDWNKFGSINEMITIGDFVYSFISQEEGTLSVIEYKGYSTEVQIPEEVNILGQKYTVAEIGNRVFYNKSDISSFKIPDTVYKISEGALDGTAWWNNQPDGVVYAGKVLYKYKGTVPLNTSIVVEEGTKGITAGAFKDQRLGTLTSITIPGSLRFIGEGAFSLSYSNDEAPIKVSISDLSAWCNIDFGNNYANPLCNYNEGLYLNEEKITELTIPGDITEVKEYVFCGTYFTKVTIPSSVTSIGNYAFGSIGNLYIEDSENVLPVGYDGYNSSGTGSCVLGSSRLKTLYLGRDLSYESAKSYGYSPFYDCDSLTTVEVGDYATEIGENLFRDCAKLTNVEFSKNTTSIGSYAFYGCESINGDIVFPKQLSSIGSYAFYDCDNITSITIPSSVTSIGNYAFYHCYSINNIYVKSETPATIGGNYAFYDQYYDTIYVPKGTKDVYQAADYWKNFENIVEMDFTITGDVDKDYEIDVADVTALVGVILNGEETEETPTEQTFEDWTSTNAGVSSSTSQNSYTLEATEGSVLTFDWSVSSESNYDWLIITIDGTQILKESGSYTGSCEHTFTTAGTHTLVVKYTKDGSANNGSDQGKIYNIKLSGSASNKNNSTADVDGDGTIDVADVTELISIILGTDTASAVPAKAAATRAGEISTVSADGDGSTLLININNPEYPFSAIQFDLELPEGIEVDFDGEYYAVDLGSRTNSRKHSYPECAIQPDGSLRVVIISMSNALYNGTEGDVATAALKVNGAADGDYRFTIKNVVLSAPGSKEKLEPYTGWINVTGGVTGISDIKEERAESNDIYDLQGRKVSNPVKGGIYIQNGKKILW